MKLIITESQLENLISDEGFFSVISGFFDRAFADLVVQENKDSQVFSWINPKFGNKHIFFQKNYWGNFMVFPNRSPNIDRPSGHKNYMELLKYQKLFSLSDDDFQSLLIQYLNNKYGHMFPSRLIKTITKHY
jgi:hypothetical protein